MTRSEILVYYIGLDHLVVDSIKLGLGRDRCLSPFLGQRRHITVYHHMGYSYTRMCLERLYMIPHSVAVGLVGLGRNVADEDLWC